MTKEKNHNVFLEVFPHRNKVINSGPLKYPALKGKVFNLILLF